MIVILLISLKRESGGGVFFSSLKRESGGGSFHFRKMIEYMYIGILLIQIRKIS